MAPTASSIAVGALRLHPPPLIVVDLGTATVFEAVSRDGDYLGGAIAPGIGVAADALASRAAMLRASTCAPPKKAIGSNTMAAMQSGILFGYAELIEGMVRRFKDEIGEDALVVGTGGWADLMSQLTHCFDHVDENLSLYGLRQLYMNSNEGSLMTACSEGKNVVLGVSGSIAAYKAADLASKLVQAGAMVDVILTDAGARVRHALHLPLAHRPPRLHDMFDPQTDARRGARRPGPPRRYRHRRPGDRHDARAHCLRPGRRHALADRAGHEGAAAHRAGHGLADVGSGRHAGQRRDPEVARRRASSGPMSGRLASGNIGAGRLAEPATILGAAKHRPGARPATSQADASSSAPAARASPSTPCASSATARAARWATRSPKPPATAAPP